MIPTKVSMSCNNNPYYLDFWEPVSRVWKKKFGIHPYLFFVGKESDAPRDEWGTVVCCDAVDDVPEHAQAQWARFHFTQTDPEAVWITSDIDMFPLSKKYFMEMVSCVPDDCFVSLNSDMKDYFPVCYNVAKGSVFQEILQLKHSFSDSVREVFDSTQSDSHTVNGQVFENWSSDERYSSRKICEFRSQNPNRVVQFFRPGGFHGGRRIDRNSWSYSEELVRGEWYLDCHSIRPYADNKDRIESLLKVVLE